MPHSQVQSSDLQTLIVAALNGVTVQGGVLSAKAISTSEIAVTTHTDTVGKSAYTNYRILIN